MQSKAKIIVLLVLFILQSKAEVITLNDIRNFTIGPDTVIRVDDITVDQNLFEIIGIGGFKVRFRIGEDVNTTISQGTFSEINLISDVIGPVTSLQPLTIMDQEVFVTSETILENLSSASQLVVGDRVKVSGAISSVDNSIALSRLEKDNTLNEWKVRGFARNVNASTFTIGNLTVNTNAVAATNCNGVLAENDFVSIKATPDINYSLGQNLATLTEIECQTADVDEDPNDTVPVVVEGVISNIVDLVSFKVNNLTVFFDANTSFDNGEPEHIDAGTKVEIQGMLDTNNRFITAQTIRFIEHRVKIIAPVEPGSIVPDQSIEIMGIPVVIIPQTRDDDNIMSQGLNSAKQIEVRGFVDSMGTVYAQRVKDKGEADANDSRLRGDISAINRPLITVLGVTIDTSNSTFELETGAVDADAFFAHIQVGMQLAIEDASYDSINTVLSLGNIEIEEEEIEDDPDTNQNKAISNTTKEIIGIGGVGLATITSIELIFSSGFE